MSASLASLNEIHSKQRALEMLGFFLINFKNSELLSCLYVKKNEELCEKEFDFMGKIISQSLYESKSK